MKKTLLCRNDTINISQWKYSIYNFQQYDKIHVCIYVQYHSTKIKTTNRWFCELENYFCIFLLHYNMTASSLKILLAIVACIAVFLFFMITYNSPQTLIFSFQELHRRESCYSNFVSKCTYIWCTNNMYIFTINVDWHVSMHLETWYWLVNQNYLV